MALEVLRPLSAGLSGRFNIVRTPTTASKTRTASAAVGPMLHLQIEDCHFKKAGKYFLSFSVATSVDDVRTDVADQSRQPSFAAPVTLPLGEALLASAAQGQGLAVQVVLTQLAFSRGAQVVLLPFDRLYGAPGILARVLGL